MSFQPVVSGQGITGWMFLQRTYDSQFKAFTKSPVLERDSKYFMENIKNVKSAADLVKDRRLLGVALGAFGLENDINNRYFIQRILEDGTEAKDALANRLADDRYKKLSKAFRFGPGEIPMTGLTSRMRDIMEKNRRQSFEVAVGQQDDSMRIALYAQRALGEMATEKKSDDAKWFSMMGLPPMRTLFETALGLPKSFGQGDIDKQKEVFQSRVRSLTGREDFEQFKEPEIVKKLTNVFLARSQIGTYNSAASANANALTLLRG